MQYRLVKFPGSPSFGLESRYVLQTRVTTDNPNINGAWVTVPIVLAETLTEAERSEMAEVLHRR